MLAELCVAVKKHRIAKQFALSEPLHSIKGLKDAKKISREDVFYFENSDLKMHAPNLPIPPIGEIGERHRTVRIVTLIIEIKRLVGMDNLQPKPRSRNGSDLVT
jgi:hypothetical protein